MSNYLFIHSHALVESENIGRGSKIFAFTHILPKAQIGSNCIINDHVFIENDVIIGNGVTIKCGVQLWDGIRVEDNVFIGPNVAFTSNDFDKNNKKSDCSAIITIKRGARIEANATIHAGITVGENSIVSAGSLVTKNVPPNTFVKGNPAYISGYLSQPRMKNLSKIEMPTRGEPGPRSSNVRGVTFYKLPLIIDMRGNLSFAEYGQFLPFVPKRYFIVFDVASQELRGEHAHKTLHEYLVCVKGQCSLIVDDGKNSEEIIMDSNNVAVHVQPMVWRIHYKYSRDAVLLVLASEIYDPDDYIRHYNEFVRMIKKR